MSETTASESDRWCFDMSKAPRGKYVVVNRKFGKGVASARVFEPDKLILASKCGKVTVSRYLPDEKRWEMFAKGEQPIAWQLWPNHPHSSLQPPSVATDSRAERSSPPLGTNLTRPAVQGGSTATAAYQAPMTSGAKMTGATNASSGRADAKSALLNGQSERAVTNSRQATT